jgi:hypothetical protein
VDKVVRACTYCSLTYGSEVHFKDGRVKILQEVEDHFWPRSLGKTEEGNIVSCCNMCNSIKTDKTFETVEEVRSFLAPIYEQVIERTFLHSPSLVREMKEVIREAKKQIDSVRALSPIQVDVPAKREVLLNSVPSSSVSTEKRATEELGVLEHLYEGVKCYHYLDERRKKHGTHSTVLNTH